MEIRRAILVLREICTGTKMGLGSEYRVGETFGEHIITNIAEYADGSGFGLYTQDERGEEICIGGVRMQNYNFYRGTPEERRRVVKAAREATKKRETKTGERIS